LLFSGDSGSARASMQMLNSIYFSFSKVALVSHGNVDDIFSASLTLSQPFVTGHQSGKTGIDIDGGGSDDEERALRH
jgi:hypothetical protein